IDFDAWKKPGYDQESYAAEEPVNQPVSHGSIITGESPRADQGSAPLMRQVAEQEEAALASGGEIEMTVAVNVGYRNLHPAAGARAVIDHVLHPRDIAVLGIVR